MKWNIYQSKLSIQAENQYLDYLIDPRFQIIIYWKFTGNLDQAGNTTIFIIIQEAKETILEGRKNCESFINLF